MIEFDENIMTYAELQQYKVDTYNASHGELHLKDGYNCDICHNKGYVAGLNEKGYEYHRFCSCNKIRAVLRRAKESGLGDILKQNTFDKYKANEDWQKHIKEKALNFCKDETAKWFYIGGQVGCGKTMICTAIAAHYIKAEKDVKYMIWAEESKRLKAIVNDKDYDDAIKIFKNVDVLYIDDFLKTKKGEQPTAADINLAFEIINHRLFDEEKITIISSEKLLDDLIDYDEATMSRIYQLTGEYKLNIKTDRKKNMRLKQ